jgi:hypothetical protein
VGLDCGSGDLLVLRFGASYCMIQEDKSGATSYPAACLKYTTSKVPRRIVRSCHLSPMMWQDESVTEW